MSVELVVNVARRACRPVGSFRGRLSTVDCPAADRVRLAVVDRASRRLPDLRAPALDDTTGRSPGLLLVEEYADRWGYDLLGTGIACGANMYGPS